VTLLLREISPAASFGDEIIHLIYSMFFLCSNLKNHLFNRTTLFHSGEGRRVLSNPIVGALLTCWLIWINYDVSFFCKWKTKKCRTLWLIIYYNICLWVLFSWCHKHRSVRMKVILLISIKTWKSGWVSILCLYFQILFVCHYSWGMTVTWVTLTMNTS
jgi:hypothetical protein